MRIDGFLVGRTEWTVMKAVAYAAIGQEPLIVCANDDRKKEIAKSAKFYVPITQGFPVLVSIVPDGVSVVPIRESMMVPDFPARFAYTPIRVSALDSFVPGKVIDCEARDVAVIDITRRIGQCWWK